MSVKQRLRLILVFSAALLLWLAGCVVQPTLPSGTVPALPPITPTALPPTIATLIATTPPQVSAALTSPDGQWQATVVIYACTDLGVEEGLISFEQLQLSAVATAEQRAVTQQQINCGGLGAYGLAALCWSADSKLLYFTDAREGVPDGAGAWQPPIFQFEQTTGQIQPYTGTVTSAQTQLPRPTACQ